MEWESHSNKQKRRSRRGRGRAQQKTRRRKLWEWLGFGKKGAKTGLDLLQFLATASIPILVAIGGLWFNEQRMQHEVLQGYLQEMGRHLLEGGLRASEEDAEIRSVAKARTSTVLSRVNVTRRAEVVQFLRDSQLIDTNLVHPHGFPGAPPIIWIDQVDLRGAQLSGAELPGAYLERADLREADLRGAKLSGAYLVGANMTEANLIAADLRGIDLTGANLREADLRGAILFDARLTDADLTDADLTGALLDDVDLDAATVTSEQLDAARSLEGAIMPDACVTLLRPSCSNYSEGLNNGYFVPSENVPSEVSSEVSTPTEGTTYACIGSPFRYAPDTNADDGPSKDSDYSWWGDANTCEPLPDPGPPPDSVCNQPIPFKLSGHRIEAFMCHSENDPDAN